MEAPVEARRTPWRVVAWLAFVLSLTALGYASHLSADDPPDDLAYRWSSSIAAVVQYALMLGILLLIARGLAWREVFALRRPRSWGRAAGLIILALLTIYVAAFAYERVLSVFGDWDPTEEQGLVPDGWDSSRAAPFAAFFLVVAVVAPVVEELIYRGLGYTLLAPYGLWAAIVVTGVLFGASHGLLVALPILAVFGVVVGVLRMRTDSVYPSMVLHAIFNGVALVVSVAAVD
jgi:uncharacterized protein